MTIFSNYPMLFICQFQCNQTKQQLKLSYVLLFNNNRRMVCQNALPVIMVTCSSYSEECNIIFIYQLQARMLNTMNYKHTHMWLILNSMTTTTVTTTTTTTYYFQFLFKQANFFLVFWSYARFVNEYKHSVAHSKHNRSLQRWILPGQQLYRYWQLNS